MNEESLTELGNHLGETFRVDINSATQTRRKFAHICVETDLSQPLSTFVDIEERKCFIEYEALRQICFTCGRFGHPTEFYPDNPKNPETNNKDSPQNTPLETPSKKKTLGPQPRMALGCKLLLEREGLSLLNPVALVCQTRDPVSTSSMTNPLIKKASPLYPLSPLTRLMIHQKFSPNP